MKNFILAALAVTITLAAVSCKKPYTCKCDGGINGKGISKGIDANHRGDAQQKCVLMNTPTIPNGYYNCRLD